MLDEGGGVEIVCDVFHVFSAAGFAVCFGVENVFVKLDSVIVGHIDKRCEILVKGLEGFDITVGVLDLDYHFFDDIGTHEGNVKKELLLEFD